MIRERNRPPRTTETPTKAAYESSDEPNQSPDSRKNALRAQGYKTREEVCIALGLTPYKLNKHINALSATYPDSLQLVGKTGFLSAELQTAIADRENAVEDRDETLLTLTELCALLECGTGFVIELIDAYPPTDEQAPQRRNRQGAVTTHFTPEYAKYLQKKEPLFRTRPSTKHNRESQGYRERERKKTTAKNITYRDPNLIPDPMPQETNVVQNEAPKQAVEAIVKFSPEERSMWLKKIDAAITKLAPIVPPKGQPMDEDMRDVYTAAFKARKHLEPLKQRLADGKHLWSDELPKLTTLLDTTVPEILADYIQLSSESPS